MRSSPTQNPDALPQVNSKDLPDHQQSPDISPSPKTQEFGGSNKPEPTRYGDWEIAGKCVDF